MTSGEVRAAWFGFSTSTEMVCVFFSGSVRRCVKDGNNGGHHLRDALGRLRDSTCIVGVWHA